MPTFPIILLIAFFTCLMLIIKLPKYDLIFYRCITKAIPWAIIGAVILGKGLYILTKLNQRYTSTSNLINGFVFLGGYYGAMLGLFLYSKLSGYQYYDITDVFSSVLPLGQAIGRIGCFCNGCCYGKRWNGFFSISYPIDGIKVNVVPTWFIESFFCFILFLILNRTKNRQNKGYYTYTYMISYSAFRFFLEFLRGDDIRGFIGHFSTSQILCAITIFLGIFTCIQSKKAGLSLIIIERNK